jgi:alkanesulfonate monooxygenase SsuD/methylene tetrahydromethanopterin reductase-like flavin-dependent oxidoreductase (luciferase family)
MKFGLFFELSVPRPWNRDSDKVVYERALEQAALAEELGFDQVWAVEHHFLEEYSHCPAPEIFLTACAMRTSRIRVGHGIVVCVPEFSHPVRIAERAAVLDIISNGRLEMGTGRSATWTELGGFRANPDETKKTWDEIVHCLPKMWTQETFAYEGRSFSMPPRAILPKPYQKPHPPLWVAVSSPGTEIDAAERGLGCLGITFGSFKEQEEKLTTYRRVIRDCEPVGEFVNEQVSTVNFLYCHREDEEGIRGGKSLLGAFGYAASRFITIKEGFPTRSYLTQGLLATLRQEAGGPGDDRGVPEGLAMGNPERVLRACKKWESVGVDRINFLLNALEVIPQEKVLQSLTLFAQEVMPHFRNHRDMAAASAAAGR